MKQNFRGVWLTFLLFFLCYLAVEIQLNVLLSLWTMGLAIYLLVKNKLPSGKNIVLSIVLAILASVAYIGLNAGIQIVFINGLISGIPTFLCSMAVFSVMEKGDDLKFIVKGTGKSALISILIGIGTGAVLSIVNFF